MHARHMATLGPWDSPHCLEISREWGVALTKEGGCRDAMVCYLGLGSFTALGGGNSLASRVPLPIVKWLK